MVATLGGALSLMTESILFDTMSSHGDALSLMVIGSLAAPLMVLWMFPEPSGRVLEEISPEKEPSEAGTEAGVSRFHSRRTSRCVKRSTSVRNT